jgi:hypothetical protein
MTDKLCFIRRYVNNTYYVDATGGLDTNTGLATDAAWQTIDKVNGRSFSPGDQILFKRGETWREQLTVPSSGGGGAPIVFGAYGTGVKPLILGSVDLSATGAWSADVGGDDTFSSATDFAGRTRTTASVAWANVPAWTSGTWYNSPDIKTIVQEIVNLSTWASGEGMVIFLEDNSSTAGAYRQFSGVEDGAANCPVLTITHTVSTVVAVKPNITSDDVTVWGEDDHISSSWCVTGNDITSRKVGIRFDDVTVPKDATIVSAVIAFKANDSVSATTCNLTIKGEAAVHLAREAIADVWCAATGAADVGNLIFNSEASCGVKQTAFSGLDTQGDFLHTGLTLYLYSDGNPGTFYTHIEGALAQNGIRDYQKHYVTFQNLAIKYAGQHAISLEGPLHNVTVEYCDMAFIGGCSLGAERYGNGVQLWDSGTDLIVRWCTADNVYDAAFTPQMSTNATSFINQYWHHNIATNSEYGFEFFCPAGSTLTNVYVCHNVFYKNGYGWGHAQRPDPKGTGMTFGNVLPTSVSNVHFKNNIIHTSTEQHVWIVSIAQFSGISLDYNDYYADGAAAFNENGDGYTFADWKTLTSWDAHSIVTDPTFVSTSDFHLQAGSPCIDAGLVIAGVGQQVLGAAPDIGVYEKA